MWQWIVANQQLVIGGIAILYMLLPATSPIKIFINNLLAKIGVSPIPQPTPDPNPTPGPVVPGLDFTTLLQLLMNVLLKQKAAGDTKAMESTIAVMDALKTEHEEFMRANAPPPPSVRYYAR